ncbi:MAG TPA: lysozyme inhibitor LprI family protein [Casimicrobiaceae bacterium]|jgi:uncharacterized protein YecT (DUF1311 family)
MNAIRRLAALSLCLSGALTSAALASALEECVPAGDHAAVLRCLTEEDVKANGELSNAEAAAAKRSRELEQATGRVGAYAALAKSVRDFAAYRTSQCAYVKETMASGTGAGQAQLGCRIDLNRRRIRDLKP